LKHSIILELRKPIIDLHTKIRTIRTRDKVFIELVNPKLLIYPRIVYTKQSKELDIGLTPFIKAEDSGTLTTYSIALENFDQNLIDELCYTCNYFTLNPFSILSIDNVMGKLLKLYKVVPHEALEVIDLANYELYAKTVHPQHNHVLFLSNNGVLGRIVLVDTGISVEELHRCRKYCTGTYESFTTSVCVNNDIFTAVSSHVYGFSAKLNLEPYLLQINTSRIYGYIKNNVYFIKFGRRGFVFNLEYRYDTDSYYKIEDADPLAFIDEERVLALNSNNLLILVDTENNSSTVLNRYSHQDVVKFFVDPNHSRIAIITNNHLDIYNVDDTPTYVRIVANDVDSVTLAKDKLVVLKKDGVDVYYIDIGSSRLYIEKFATLPRYFADCTSLEDDIVLCIDRLGRITMFNIEKLLDLVPRIKVLNSVSGFNLYIFGEFTPLMINPVYEKSLIKIRASQFLLKSEEVDIEDILIPNIKLKPRPYRVLVELPKNFDVVKVLQVNDKHIILSKLEIVDHNLVLKYILDDYSRIDINTYVHPSLYLVKNVGNLEWGVYLDKVDIIKLKIDELLRLHQDQICLNKDMLEKNNINLSNTSLIAICNNILAKGICIDLSKCSKLLKLILEIDGKYVSMPVYNLCKPRVVFKDDIVEPYIMYNRGIYEVMLPRKCVEIQDTYFNVSESKIFLKISNRCRKVWGSVVIENSVLPVEPLRVKEVSIDVDWQHILSDYGLQIVVFETTGYMHQCTIPLTFENVMAIAMHIALKVAKMLGIRSSDIRVSSNVYENLYPVSNKNTN
jgi:hypothetical protein